MPGKRVTTNGSQVIVPDTRLVNNGVVHWEEIVILSYVKLVENFTVRNDGYSIGEYLSGARVVRMNITTMFVEICCVIHVSLLKRFVTGRY